MPEAATKTKLEEAQAGLAQCEADIRELQSNFRINRYVKPFYLECERKALKAWQDVVQQLGGTLAKEEKRAGDSNNDKDGGTGKRPVHV